MAILIAATDLNTAFLQQTIRTLLLEVLPMKLTLTALTIATALIAGGASADEVGRYMTIALPNSDIIKTDTKEGKIKSCRAEHPNLYCTSRADES